MWAPQTRAWARGNAPPAVAAARRAAAGAWAATSVRSSPAPESGTPTRPGRDPRIVGVGFVQGAHDRLEDVPQVGADVDEREVRAVARGQLLGERRLVGLVGPRARV